MARDRAPRHARGARRGAAAAAQAGDPVRFAGGGTKRGWGAAGARAGARAARPPGSTASSSTTPATSPPCSRPGVPLAGRAGRVRRGRSDARARSARRRRRHARRHRGHRRLRAAARAATAGCATSWSACESRSPTARREERRQGDQERGGLRPRQAVRRLASARSGRSSRWPCACIRCQPATRHRGRASSADADELAARRIALVARAARAHGLRRALGGRRRARCSCASPGAAPRPQAEAAARLLREAGLDAEIAEDDEELWAGQRAAPARRRAPRCTASPALPTRLPALLARRRATPAARSWAAPRSGSRGCAARRRAPTAIEALRAQLAPSPCVVLDRPPALDVDPWGPLDPRRRRADAPGEGALRPGRRLQPGRVRGGPVSGYDDTRAAAARADRRLRPLRLLPAHLPDLHALGRGDGLAARADRADEGGPRGRSRAPLVEHLDRCLGCMACVTACPSGVQYDKLLEDARAQVERNFERPPAERAHRRLVFELFTRPGRLRALPRRRAAARRSGSTASRGAARAAGCPRLAALMATRARRAAAALASRLPRALRGPRRAARQRRAASGLRAAGLLRRRQRGDRPRARGRGLRGARAARCRAAAARCRSTRARTREARALAKATIEALEGYDTVIVNAAGCGSAMKDYGHVLRDEPDWAERAEALLGARSATSPSCSPRSSRAAERAPVPHARRLPRRLPPRPRPGRPRPAARAAPRDPRPRAGRAAPSGSSAAARPGIYNLSQARAGRRARRAQGAQPARHGRRGGRGREPRLRAPDHGAHRAAGPCAAGAPPDGAAGALHRLGGRSGRRALSLWPGRAGEKGLETAAPNDDRRSWQMAERLSAGHGIGRGSPLHVADLSSSSDIKSGT